MNINLLKGAKKLCKNIEIGANYIKNNTLNGANNYMINLQIGAGYAIIRL